MLVGLLMLAGCDAAVDSGPAHEPSDSADSRFTAPASGQTFQLAAEDVLLHVQQAGTAEEAARAPFQCYIRMRSTERLDLHQLSAWEAGPSAVERTATDVQHLGEAPFQYDAIILHPSKRLQQSMRESGDSVGSVRLYYQLQSPEGTVLREAYCRVPDQPEVKRQMVAQLSWSTQAHVAPSYAAIDQEEAKACGDADICITETARTTDVGSALYVPQSCDGPGGGGGDGGDGGSGGGDAGGGNWPPDDGDGGGSDWPDNPPDDPFPDDPPTSPDPPEDPPEPPPSDPAPPDDGDDDGMGGDECDEQFVPSEDCVLAVNPSQSVFGIATQSCCIRCPDEGDDPTPWALAKNIGGKMLKAVQRGEDLLDARTWKNMLESEWAEAAQAGLDVQAALNGDVVALLSVVDYIAEQTVGFGFFDMLQGLKLADRLGGGWYDDVIGGLHNSQYFPQLAQASGNFANTIGDLDVLYDASRIGQRSGDSYRVYRLMDGNAREVFGNFSRKWEGRAPTGSIPDIIDYGNTTMILRRSSTDNNLPTIEIQGPFGPTDSRREIRFGQF